MGNRLIETVFRHAEAFASGDRNDTASDADLYRAFLADGSHAAFAALVHRHGPMVWGVCRNLLGEADAEDAFQAVFLGLIRAGASVRDPNALGGWLHRVAVHVCHRSKRGTDRRRLRESRVASSESVRPAPDAEWQDLHAAVHSEIDRLPGRLRSIFVLCGLEGVRPTDAAARLGIKVGTATGLLTRARQRILARLKDHGLVPGLAGGTALVAAGSSPAIPFALIERVTSLARADVAAGASSAVLSLARLATESPMVRLKILTVTAMIGIALSCGIGARFLASSAAQTPGAGQLPPSDLLPNTSSRLPAITEDQLRLNPVQLEDANLQVSDSRLQPQTSARQAWEYQVIGLRADARAQLNDLGNEGWELVNVDRTTNGLATAYLKRPKSTRPGSSNTTRSSNLGSNRLLNSVLDPSTSSGVPVAPEKVVEMVRLRNISSASAEAVVKDLFTMSSGFGGVSADAQTNSLILSGTKERVKEIKALIEKVDGSKPATTSGASK